MTEPAPAAHLDLPDGLPGLGPDLTAWVLTDLTDGGEYQLLAAAADPDVSLVVATPWQFFPDYELTLDDGDATWLGLADPTDAIVLCTVNLPDGDDVPTMNLQGPIVVNVASNVGRQVIVDSPDVGVRVPLPVGG